LLRIDDIDTLRNQPGAVESILHCLEHFELLWDGEIDFQSRHLERYQSALEQLIADQHVYACSCNRKQLSSQQGIYPQTCRTKQLDLTGDVAIRLKTEDLPLNFLDGIQNSISCNLLKEQGDFVIKRKDGFFAYQLAVVVDDHRQGITDVVRGFDLLDSTPRQIYLQQLLAYPTPRYSHIPIIVDAQGQKLSKQTQAEAVRTDQPHQTLLQLLEMLGQQPPSELRYASVTEILNWAISNWQKHRLQQQQTVQLPFN
jgi:glutamyl-Q tRNA(Asp) synthetase